MSNLFFEFNLRNVFKVATAFLIVCWLVLQAPSAFAVATHGDEDMDAARQAMVTFAYAMLAADGDAADNVLHEDFATSWGWNKQRVIKLIANGKPWVSRIDLKHAFFKKLNERILVTPVLQYDSTHRNTYSFELAKEDNRWLIVKIDQGAETPTEIHALDQKNPEHHVLYPVAVQLRDTATSEPVFARVSVIDSNGEYWPPEGHMKKIDTGWNPKVGGDVSVGGKFFAYVGPEFTLPLPVGSYDINVVRGIEYEPRTLHFEVSAKSDAKLDIGLKRWSNVSRDGWYSGDTHVHFIDPTTGMLEMKAEDLNVLNILVTKWAELTTNAEHFTGAPSLLSEAEHIVYVNEESRHGFLGHTILMNLKKLVYPLSWGPQAGGGVIGGPDYPPMANVADEAHSQGGFVTWAHFPFPQGELAVDMALGKIDSIDLMTVGDAFNDVFGQLGPADTWYRYLNLGFKVPATAGTDKMQNTSVLGAVRTYVKMEGPLSYDDWIEGIRAGRTFTTTGPMIQLSIEGVGIGETIKAKRDKTVSVHVSVNSLVPMEKIEIVQGGKIIATKENSAGDQKLDFTIDVEISKSTWIAARTSSSTRLPFNQKIPVFAHTSPIYIDIAGMPISSPQDAVYFANQCDDAIHWAKTKATFLDENHRIEMIALFEKAKRIYLNMAAISIEG